MSTRRRLNKYLRKSYILPLLALICLVILWRLPRPDERNGVKSIQKPAANARENIPAPTLRVASHPATESPPSDTLNFTVVTGASDGYFGGLRNLVGSIHFWEPRTNIVVYDLGLANFQKRLISQWCWTTLLSFDFAQYPAHVSVLKEYAWKPVIMKDAVDKYGKILWIDAGSDVRGPLKKIDKYLSQDGHFLVQGQDEDMTLFSHNATFKYFSSSKEEFLKKPSYSGNLQGWVRGSRAYIDILLPLKACALTPECITPPGSMLFNHRYDQTALSILAYKSGLPITPHTELLAAERRQLSENYRQPSDMVVYTARQYSSDYAYSLCTFGSKGWKIVEAFLSFLRWLFS
ncbi:uncharacterized protein LOC106172863 [Lingula anatina]|uniref:Uncharacterized protein LOC106172863 n=1 Tax=Lingula anatina TaxID=7574 RepID=A0A1S3JH54_LINAN|nr:uncharacterized protein LOC106172863 [Lingula anatina]|eukprot:XP_013409229.1 uncharacterized protein LOC106172863 [Lingula anatina]